MKTMNKNIGIFQPLPTCICGMFQPLLPTCIYQYHVSATSTVHMIMMGGMFQPLPIHGMILQHPKLI